MNESEIGNRGSKLVITEKEQRVDGGRPKKILPSEKNFTALRCTLMGFERNYQVKTLSKLISFTQIRFNSTNSLTVLRESASPFVQLSPWLITGISENYIYIYKYIYIYNLTPKRLRRKLLLCRNPKKIITQN